MNTIDKIKIIYDSEKYETLFNEAHKLFTKYIILASITYDRIDYLISNGKKKNGYDDVEKLLNNVMIIAGKHGFKKDPSTWDINFMRHILDDEKLNAGVWHTDGDDPEKESDGYSILMYMGTDKSIINGNLEIRDKDCNNVQVIPTGYGTMILLPTNIWHRTQQMLGTGNRDLLVFFIYFEK